MNLLKLASAFVGPGTFPVAGTPPEESPNHPGHPLSLVMWAYADPRDVVDAHIRVRGARL